MAHAAVTMLKDSTRARWKIAVAAIALLGFLMALSGAAGTEEVFQERREAMVREVMADMAATAAETGRALLSPRVLEALRRVPRHRFVPEKLRDAAYENRPLPIGYGQTISQPFIVALMTELLDLPENARVLEIGTGSGYQAAILAEIAREVFTVEIIPELGTRAEERLKELGYANVHVKIGDGYFGWEEHAPFDAIMVTAAAPQIPPPLVRQIKPGGTLIVPVGPPFLTQFLTVVKKAPDRAVSTKQVLPVAFVPLTGARKSP